MYSVNILKASIKSIIRSHPLGQVTEGELKKELENRDSIDVDNLLREYNHKRLFDLITEWDDEFIINYSNLLPTIRTKQGDHISRMNKNLKRKSGTTRKFINHYDTNENRNMKVYMHPNAYGFSPDSSPNSAFTYNDKKFDEEDCNKSDKCSTLFFDETDFQKFLKMPNNLKSKIYDSSPGSQVIENKLSQVAIKDLNTVGTPNSSNVNSSLLQMKRFNCISTSGMSNAPLKTPKLRISNPMMKKSSMVHKLIKNINKTIPTSNMLEPSIISAVLLEVVNPHRFWFAEYNEYKSLREVMKNMEEFYTVYQDSLRIDIRDVQRGLFVAALFNKIWHRGMILKKLDNSNFVRISYVDFGTVDTISISDVCYLKEDFSHHPLIARRGVLAYIQPKPYDIWSDRATIFFKSCLENNKFDAKIFNVDDNSYYLGIKYKATGGMKLLTGAMVLENLAQVDIDFMENGIVSADSFNFSYYEEGKLLDQESQSLEAFDSWIPAVVPRANNQKSFTPNLMYKSRSEEQSNINRTLTPQNQLQNSKSEFGENKLKRNLTKEFNDVEKVDESSTKNDKFEKTVKIPSYTQTSSTNSVSGISIKTQTFQKVVIGSETKICINKVYSPSCFYFFLEEEIKEVKKFLDNLNNYYNDKENLETEDVELEKEVVVSNDSNYCRGRINSKIGDYYQIFLIDFGIFIMKKENEIYKLKKEFVKRQACVYKGAVSNNFVSMIKCKTFIRAKIMGVDSNEIFEIKLI